MLRVAASAGRLASRSVRLIPRNLPAAAVAVQQLGLKTLAATTPRSLKASSSVNFAAAAEETSAAPTTPGKISQVIGAVVDVHFGMYTSIEFFSALYNPRAHRIGSRPCISMTPLQLANITHMVIYLLLLILRMIRIWNSAANSQRSRGSGP